jgi:hypothetical protein
MSNKFLILVGLFGTQSVHLRVLDVAFQNIFRLEIH